MPTSRELRKIGFSWLDTLIGRNYGLVYWAQKLKIPPKRRRSRSMTDNEITTKIFDSMEFLGLERMPSRSELLKLEFGKKLHDNIVDTYGYREWAFRLKLSLKDSETKFGMDHEEIFTKRLRGKGYKVDVMTTKHPFDLLVDGSVKVDIKVARPHMLRGESRVHTFATGKKYGSCDLYIAIALDENEKVEKTLVIPSHHLQIVTLCIGRKSKYDVYNNRFDLIDTYSDFFDSIQ